MRSAMKATFGGGILGVIALAAVCLAAAPEDLKVDLKVGDPAPTFEAKDDQGKSWKSSQRVGEKYVVVYFYPGDFTPGCIRQAQSFRDGMNKLTAKGVEVVGVSGDSVKTHEMFKKDQKLNFTLLADENGELAKKFGVPVGKGGQVRVKNAQGMQITLSRAVTAARWTFVIGKNGKIIYKNTNVNPALDSKQVTELIEKLEKK
jgi:peroxiredoxin Q/BCP